MTGPTPIKVDLNKAFKIIDTSIKRAYIFAGFSLNATAKNDFNDYNLSK